MTAIITKGNFPTPLVKGYATKFYGSYDMYNAQWAEIFKKETSKRAFEMDVLTDNFSVIPYKPETTDITYQSAQQRFNTVYNHTSFGGGFQISREAKDDEIDLDLMKKYMSQLGEAAKRTNEIRGANVLNRGYDSSYTGGDGVSLYTTLHPVANGYQANTLSNQVMFSEEALEDLCTLVKKMKDFNGNFAALETKKLIIPPALEFEAERILNSVARVATADNDLNAIRARGKFPEGFVINQYLDSDNRYFINTNAEDGLKYFERTPPEFSMDSAFDAEVSKYKIFFRNSFGWTDFRGSVSCGNF